MDILIGGVFEFHLNTFSPTDGASSDADSPPTFAVYAKGSDTVVATGTCTKRNDAGTTGHYVATGTISEGTYTDGQDYYVCASGAVTGDGDPVLFSDVLIGVFRAVSALYAVSGDEMDLVDSPNSVALDAIDDALSDSHGSGSWEVPDGDGAFPITLTVVDDNALPVSGAKVRLQVTGGFAVKITDSNGQVSFNSDAGSWLCYVGTSASYAPNASYTVIINSSGVLTSGNIVVTAVTIPASSVSSVTLYSDEYNPEGNVLVGASDRTAYVVAMLPGSKFIPADKVHYHALSDKGTGVATNASGRWEMELPLGVTVIVKIVDATTGKAEAWQVAIPSTAGAYSLWELGPEEVTLVL